MRLTLPHLARMRYNGDDAERRYRLSGEQTCMTTHTAPVITALQAQATANLLLSDHLPDRFTADQARFDPQAACWHVPVILTYPGIGVLGTVGDIQVAAQAETVIAHTPFEVMWHTARSLYDTHRDAIDTTVV